MKRFTETIKWQDRWFRRLSPTAKLLWLYLTDNCDRIGLIDLDFEAASFFIGANVEEKHLAELGDRTERTVDGKIFLPRFITFQYGVLSEDCPPHKPILRLIHELHLTPNGKGYQYPNARVAVGMPIPKDTLEEEDKKKTRRGSAEGDLLTAEQIYDAYPRKVDRADALRAIKKAMKTHDPKILLDKTRAYAQTQPKNDQFTPYPATWFNKERFLDPAVVPSKETPIGAKSNYYSPPPEGDKSNPELVAQTLAEFRKQVKR